MYAHGQEIDMHIHRKWILKQLAVNAQELEVLGHDQKTAFRLPGS